MINQLRTINDDLYSIPRSSLYCLKPIKKGTLDQESLISFIVRTAKAHAISPRYLITDILHQRKCSEKIFTSFFDKSAKTINSLGRYAHEYTYLMNGATGRNDLADLTLLYLGELLSKNGIGLLAHHPQWCPTCLDEQDETFFPLKWSIHHYRVCAKHLCHLENRCPKCKKTQPFIPILPELSVCKYCNSLLNKCTPRPSKERVMVWISIAIEDLISGQDQGAEYLTKENLFFFFNETVNRYASGKRAVYCRHIGLSGSYFNSWFAQKGRMVTLTQLLLLSYCCYMLPTEMFIKYNSQEQYGIREAPNILKPKKIRRIFIGKIGQRFESAMKSALKSDPACSMKQLAKSLDVHQRTLKDRFPDLYQSIQKRYQEHMQKKALELKQRQIALIEQTVYDLVQEGGDYPSQRKVRTRLQQHKISLQTPYLQEAYLQARKKYYDDTQ